MLAVWITQKNKHENMPTSKDAYLSSCSKDEEAHSLPPHHSMPAKRLRKNLHSNTAEDSDDGEEDINHETNRHYRHAQGK